VKTSELTGTALDWAVAKCEGHTVKTYRNWLETENDYWKGRDCYFAQNHPVIVFPGGVKAALVPAYSTDWTQAGPIIESERIDVFSITYGSGWCAQPGVRVFNGYGQTPLVAAMRCYVASKLGDEVELPKG
jgi:hypothetical protein